MRLAPLFVLPIAVVACGSPPAKEPSQIATQFACQAPPPAAPSAKPALPARKPPTVGPPSEDMSQARKLFEAEKWTMASAAFDHVVKGETKDDDGNRQVAEFYAAECLWHLHKYADAGALFVKIAGDRNHVKNEATLLWLLKMMANQRDAARIEWFANYDEEDVVKFDNNTQRTIFFQAAFIVGWRLYQDGELDRAEPLFARVAGDPSDEAGLVAESKHCTDQILAAKTAGWRKGKREQEEKK